MQAKIKYFDGYKYQLAFDYTVHCGILGYVKDTPFLSLDFDGVLTIKHGYAWDGASGVFTVQTKNTMRASLVHDALYQLMRLRLIMENERQHADKLFYKMLIEDGMFKFRAKYFYAAVCVFGAEYAHTLPDMLTAP